MIILASQSPRRKEILGYYVKDFEIIPSNFDESTIETPKDKKQLAKLLSYHKAKDVFESHPDDIVVGSDTIVIIDNKVLGKPKTEEEAKAMLKSLQGRKHLVVTGVCVMSKDKVINFIDVAKVFFAKMSEEDISYYVSTKEPMDKAGAYGIQGIGGQYIRKVKGDFFTVMGLPLYKTSKALKKMVK